jgi:hypothetical protein
MTFDQDIQEIARLLDAYVAEGAAVGLSSFVVEPPEEVRVGELNPDGWGMWKMIPSPVTRADIELLEMEAGMPLPPFYAAFLCCRVLLDLDFGDYQLPPILPRNALSEVRQYLFSKVPPGFLTFGSARSCGDPLCFDLSARASDGDCPVVVFNHDVVPQAVWQNHEALQRYAARVAPSFRSFLTRLLTGDLTSPPPPSAEELRRDAAWRDVRDLLSRSGLPHYYRPPGVDEADPWAIVEFLRNSRDT